MSKRVFEIAKEFNTETKVILEMLKKHQIKASNGFSSVGDEEYEKIKAEIGSKKAAKQPAKAAAQNYAVADGRKPEERQRSEKKQQERAAQKQREKEEQAAKAAQSAKAETKEKEAAPQEKTTAVPAAEAAAGGSAASATDAARQPERESAGSPRMETEEKPAAAKREYRSKNIEEKSQGGSRSASGSAAIAGTGAKSVTAAGKAATEMRMRMPGADAKTAVQSAGTRTVRRSPRPRWKLRARSTSR